MRLIKNCKYHIYWHDTLCIEGWCNMDQIINKAKECAENQETIGFYICDSHDYHIFASTINNSEGMLPYSSVNFIPKGCIKRILKM